MDERELSLAVVGIGYDNADKAKSNRRFEVALCRPGEPVAQAPRAQLTQGPIQQIISSAATRPLK